MLDRGILTFEEHCKATGRHDMLDYVQLQHNEQHLVHRSCRREMAYAVRKAGSKVAPSKRNVYLSTHSKTGSFMFSDMCFLCGSSCKDSKDVRKVLSGSHFDDSIRKTVRKHHWF